MSSSNVAILPFFHGFVVSLPFLGGLVIKNPPPMQEAWVQSLGQEDSLEQEMATHSSVLAWEIP